MGIERILTSSSAGPLLGGLSWRPPSGGRHSMRKLFEARNLATDATHYTLLTSANATVYGLFQPRASEESLRLPKGALSAAQCFAEKIGSQAPNAALVLTVRTDSDRKDQKVYVVVLDDGVPVIDSLTTEMEARNALGSEERPIWSDDALSYPNAVPIDFEGLAEFASKAAKVAPIPMNPWPLAATTVAIAVGASVWFYAQHVRRVEAEREQQRVQLANDPVPRYLSALHAATNAMSSNRPQLLAAVESLFEMPVVVPGWRMRSVECSASAQQCAATWIRHGGTFDELRAARPDERLVLVTGDGSPVPLLDTARTLRNVTISRTTLPVGARNLRPLGEAIDRVGGLLQTWRTAKLSIDIHGPSLWPRVDAVPPGFDHPDAVASGRITLGDVPGPFIVEALRDSPPWISWELVRADIGDGEPAERLKFKATGTYYASLH